MKFKVGDHAVKNDQGKPRMGLLPSKALMSVSEVLGYGAQKYDDHNWRSGFKWSRLYDAVLRHLFAWIGGEDKDPESGLSHLGHAACGILMLLEHEIEGIGNDDRFKKD